MQFAVWILAASTNYLIDINFPKFVNFIIEERSPKKRRIDPERKNT